ncbi:MAG: HAD-IA family hydrolase [Phycisphaerales bacterium]|nr:HAD-IA family hydrolase [Phycisphaerales bacterium]
MPARKPPALCVFDLDGTLIDSLRDIANAVNASLALFGRTPWPLEAVQTMVGEGVPVLCRRAMPDAPESDVQRLIELTRGRYRAFAMEHTRPYLGIKEMVQRLAATGAKLGVLTNKPHGISCRIVRALWPNGEFAQVEGYVREAARKPNAGTLLRMAETAGVSIGETVLIGDTPTDVKTAANAGSRVLAVTWGFRGRAELEAAGAREFVDRPEEIPAALGY